MYMFEFAGEVGLGLMITMSISSILRFTDSILFLFRHTWIINEVAVGIEAWRKQTSRFNSICNFVEWELLSAHVDSFADRSLYYFFFVCSFFFRFSLFFVWDIT